MWNEYLLSHKMDIVTKYGTFRGEIEAAARALASALDANDAVGISAPQIGLSWQMLAIRVTEGQVDMMNEQDVAVKDIQVVPLTIIVNPRLKVLNHKEVIRSDIEFSQQSRSKNFS